MPELEILIHELERALLSLDRLEARRILTESSGAWTPIQLIEKLVAPTLQRIGAGWERGEIALSQVYMSGRIGEDLVNTILPPSGTNRKDQPQMAIAVLEDYHLLGKRIVCTVLRSAGFDLLDYGHGVTVDNLVKRVLEEEIQILLISTLMLKSALRVKDVTAKLHEADADIKIVVGGAPFRFDHRLWQDVGADAMGRSASEAIEVIKQVMGG
jgi:methanogenic corrinoid protein MtbC1